MSTEPDFRKKRGRQNVEEILREMAFSSPWEAWERLPAYPKGKDGEWHGMLYPSFPATKSGKVALMGEAWNVVQSTETLFDMLFDCLVRHVTNVNKTVESTLPAHLFQLMTCIENSTVSVPLLLIKCVSHVCSVRSYVGEAIWQYCHGKCSYQTLTIIRDSLHKLIFKIFEQLPVLSYNDKGISFFRNAEGEHLQKLYMGVSTLYPSLSSTVEEQIINMIATDDLFAAEKKTQDEDCPCAEEANSD